MQRVRYETIWLGTLTEQTELAQDQLTAAPCGGCQVAKGAAPVIESGLIKVRTSRARERASQVRENPLRVVVSAAESTLVSQPISDPPIQRCRTGNFTHDAFSPIEAIEGTGKATVRNMSASMRR